MKKEFQEALELGENLGAAFKLFTPREAGTTGAGIKTGSRSGQSIDFRDYRDYQPGDDLRNIDWNVYARSDKLTVKLFHEEVNPHLDLIVDTSLSMDLAGTAKAGAALNLASLLATAAGNTGCTCTPWCATNDGIVPPVNCSGAPSQWIFNDFASTVNMAESMNIHPPALRSRSIRIVISDLLWPGDPLNLLRSISEKAAKVVVIQVLANSEMAPDERGNLRLLDSETGQMLEVFLDETACTRYLNALQSHLGIWQDACRMLNSSIIRIQAEDFLKNPDMTVFENAEILEAV